MPTRAAQAAFDAKSRIAQRSDRRAADRFREDETLSLEQIHWRQTAKGMALARYAFDNSPFYRERYSNAGFRRDDLRDPSVFDELPVVSKHELRERSDEILVGSAGDRRRLPSSTGGSTGEPLTLFHDRRAPVAAMWWRVFRWWGLSPADNRAVIQRERRAQSTRVREQLEWWPTVQISLDAREMTESSMRAFAEEWAHYEPKLLNGYVGAVHEFAAWVAESGIQLPPPRAIGVTAAPITASQRRVIADALGAPVFDSYRSAEVPWIAAECSAHDGLHVLADVRMVEVLDNDGRQRQPGQEGLVVITDLSNRVFPLVRYSIGDRTSTIAGTCSCGMTLPRIAPVQGRVSDVMRLPGGQRIAGGLTGLFNDRPDAVTQFQVHQHDDMSITLRCVPGTASDAILVIEAAVEKLSQLVQNSVPVRAEYVTSIGHDRGKFRVIRSDVPEVAPAP